MRFQSVERAAPLTEISLQKSDEFYDSLNSLFMAINVQLNLLKRLSKSDFLHFSHFFQVSYE